LERNTFSDFGAAFSLLKNQAPNPHHKQGFFHAAIPKEKMGSCLPTLVSVSF
jgi:hypothetical protein